MAGTTPLSRVWCISRLPPPLWRPTELRVGNTFALPGGTAVLPVLFTRDTNVVAAQFDLLVGSTNISSGEAVGGSALADHVVTSGIPTPGRRRVVIYSPTNASLASGVLVSIPLTLASNTAYGSIPLTLTNVVLANYDGVVVTNITLISGSLTCTSSLPALPVFLTQPQSQTVAAGTDVSFTAIVAGEEPLTYQWRFNGTNQPGAATVALSLTNVQPGSIGAYSMVVSNPNGSVTSQLATLNIPIEQLYTAVSGSGGIGISPSADPYYLGQTRVLTAAPGRWYRFLQWTDGETNSPRTITIGLTNTYTAIFTNVPPLETWTNDAGVVLWEVPVGTPKILVNGTPTFGGNFTFTSTNPPTIDITTSFPDGTIFYTLNGSDPLDGGIYDGTPFAVTDSAVLRAVALDSSFVEYVEADPVNIIVTPVYWLTLTTNGLGSVTLDPPGGAYLINTMVTITETPSPGWGFAGWSGDLNGAARTVAITMDQNKNIQANFYQIPLYELTLVTNGNGSVSVDPAAGSYLSNTVVTLTATPAAGWGFSGWSGDGAGISTNILVTMDRNKTVQANFYQIPIYTLTLITNGSGSITVTPPGGAYLSNTVVTLSTTAAPEWFFNGWSGDAAGFDTNLVVVMNTNRTILAAFEQVPKYSVLATTPGGGSISLSPANGPYLSNTLVSITATASNGWTFLSWTGDRTSTNPVLNVAMISSLSVQAVFATPVTNFFCTPTGAGTIVHNPVQALYPYGSAIQLTAVPISTNYFRLWGGDAASFKSNSPINYLVTKANPTNSALFAPLPTNNYNYNLIVLINGGGSVSRNPFQSYYASNALVMLTATPADTNWFFAGWSGDATGGSNTLFLTVNTNKTVTASFVQSGPPVIVTQPAGQQVLAGSNALFSVVVGGMAPLSYQWRFNSGNLGGETNASLLLTNVLPSQAGAYDVLVTNVFGSVTSAVAPLTVNYSLSLSLSGNGSIAVDPPQTAFLPGASVVLTALPGSNQVFLGWSGSLAGTSNSVTLTMDGNKSVVASFGPNQPPTVSLTAPANGSVLVMPANVAMQAVAGDDLGVGWVDFYASALLLGSVTNPPYSFTWTNAPVGTNILAAVATDLGGLAATSAPVSITVIAPPTITNQPQGLLVLAGTNVMFSVGAAGTPPLHYQWRFNGGAVAGATNTSFLLSGVQPVQAGGYDVVVTNAGGAVTSAVASLTVNYALSVSVNGNGTVSLNPNQSSFGPGSSVALTAVPATNWFFTGWTGDAGGAAIPLTVLMTTNKSILANFSTNGPPTVAITDPLAGATFAAPGPVVISAAASSLFGTVASVGFYAGTNLLGLSTNPPFGCTWTNATVGSNILTAVATDNFGVSAWSAPVSILVTPPPPAPAVFSLSSNAYTVLGNAGSVAVIVLKSPNSLGGTVNYATANGSALAYNNGAGNYYTASGSLGFTNAEPSKTVVIQIVNLPVYVGNRSFSFQLSSSGDGSSVGAPDTATITIIDVNPPQTTNSFLQHFNPGDVPLHNGQLSIALEPDYAGGQWRLVWETAWRNSWDIISGLPSGNYPVEFKPVAGFLAPPVTTNPVTTGALTLVTNVYAATGTAQYGSLGVTVQPPAVAGATDVNLRGQWRLQGDTNWHDSGFTYSSVIAGSQIVEFKTISGWVRPAPRMVLVGANQGNVISATYLVAPVSGATQPSLLQFSQATGSAASGLPYVYCGQLLTEVGYGSGCVVKRRVVLTAAHVFFNDATLAYVPSAHWFFQRYAGTYEPPAQAPRGWYIFDGYAAARTNDNSPGVSSPLSQNLDVAALYFLADAGRGGASGYLVSDPSGTEWLQTNAFETLVGYPVEVVSDSNRGKPHATISDNLIFALVTNRVFSTAAISGYPGMSGGPLCVQYTNGTYFPAAVYLGGSDQTIVRAIDGAVADLINRADVTANTGENNTGGGVIRLQVGSGGSGLLAYVQVTISPQTAVAAGAAWRLLGTSNWSTGPTYTAALATNGSAILEFKAIAGWNLPTNQTLTLTLGQTTIASASYTLAPCLTFSPASGLAASGFVGGPFIPPSATYILTNSGGASLDWLATSAANWLSLSASGGTLPAGASTNVTISLNVNASSLAAGTYSDTVSFTNLTTGLGSTNFPVTLNVVVHPTVQLSGVRLRTNGAVAMTLQGVTGGVYSIVASTNLLNPLGNWTEVLRLTNTGGQTVFTNPPPSSTRIYYRAKEL